MQDLIERWKAISKIAKYGSVWMEYTDEMSKEEIAEQALRASKYAMIRILKELPPAKVVFQPNASLWECVDGVVKAKEPFINKPCFSEQACHEDKMNVLKKIKKEIEENRDEWLKGQDPEWHAYDRCVAIINKHMEEGDGE